MTTIFYPPALMANLPNLPKLPSISRGAARYPLYPPALMANLPNKPQLPSLTGPYTDVTVGGPATPPVVAAPPALLNDLPDTPELPSLTYGAPLYPYASSVTMIPPAPLPVVGGGGGGGASGYPMAG